MACRVSDDEDDGFGDFLSEDEEECALQAQEMAALERRMKTEGIRDGIEFGKEDTLQQGFDDGFALGAAASFRFSVLRGALSAAKACGLLATAAPEQLQTCDDTIASLRQLEVQSAFVSGSDSAAAAAAAQAAQAPLPVDTAAVVAQACTLLEQLQIRVPTA